MSLNDKKHFLKDVFTVRIRADLSFETWSVTDRVKETTGIRERVFPLPWWTKEALLVVYFSRQSLFNFTQTKWVRKKSHQKMTGRSCFTAYHYLQIHVKQRVLKKEAIGSEAFQFTFFFLSFKIL